MKNRENSDDHTLRIKSIPRTYLSAGNGSVGQGPEEAQPSAASVRFERLLTAMTFAGVPVLFSSHSVRGADQLGCISPGASLNLLTVEAAFQAQFPDFQTSSQLTTRSAESPCAVAVISGVPIRTHEAPNSLAHIMTRFQGSAIYRVSAWPVRASRVSRFVAKPRCRSALERSERQETSAGFLFRQENRRRVDVVALERSRIHETTYRLAMSDREMKCQVVLVFWDSPEAVVCKVGTQARTTPVMITSVIHLARTEGSGQDDSHTTLLRSGADSLGSSAVE